MSQEAYEQARTELAMLYADIDIVKSNIALTELHAPFDGVIGLRNVSEGAYASPDVVVAKAHENLAAEDRLLRPRTVRQPDQARHASHVHRRGARRAVPRRGLRHRVESGHRDPHFRRARALPPTGRANRLLPGRFADVKIRMHDIPDAIAIPTEAIVPEMGVDKVYLYKGEARRGP